MAPTRPGSRAPNPLCEALELTDGLGQLRSQDHRETGQIVPTQAHGQAIWLGGPPACPLIKRTGSLHSFFLQS